MENETLTFERTSDLDVLSSFSCGVRKIDFILHSKSEQQSLYSFLKDTNNEMMVVSYRNAPVALFVCHIQIESTFKGLALAKQIDILAVKQENQRQGIGRKIIETLTDISKSEGIKYLTVGAYYDNKYSAIGFYEKCGFEPNGRKSNHILQMVKRLSEDA